MFLIASTKHQLETVFPDMHVHYYTSGGFVMTTATDEDLAFFSEGDFGFQVTEMLRHPHDDSKKIVYSRFIFDKATNTFRILQSTVSGRPIYFHVDESGEFFCSTHISLLRKAGVVIQENTNALPEFFMYRCVLPPVTLYKNISKVLNGAQVVVSLHKGRWQIDSIDTTKNFFANKEGFDLNKNEVSMAKKVLGESIQNIPFPPQDVGALLSGGIDSTILCKLLQETLHVQDTYSGGYPFERDEANIEKQYALSAAKAINTKHSYYEPTNEEYVKGIIESIALVEEPLHHLQTAIIHLMLKNAFPPNKKIIVSGMGADGIFGDRLAHNLYKSQRPHWKLFAKQPFFSGIQLVSKVTNRGSRFLAFLDEQNKQRSFEDPQNMLWVSGQYGSKEWVLKHFQVTEQEIVASRQSAMLPFKNDSLYRQLEALDYMGNITQSIWSKLAQGNGKIMYYPYYDESVVTITQNMNLKTKLKRPKNVLRQVAKDLKIPSFIITRKKSGFGVNRKDWAVAGGPLDLLSPLVVKIVPEEYLDEVQSTHPQKAMIFWNVVNYAIWKRLCILGESPETLLAELDVQINHKYKKQTENNDA